MIGAGDPAAPALADVHERWTYGRLDGEVTRLARRLRRGGVRPGTVVPVLGERDARTIVAVLAVLRAGGAFCVVDAAVPTARKRVLLADCAGPVVVAPRGVDVPLPARTTVVAATDGDDGGDDGGPPDPPADATDDDPAYLVHTSGSTGTPKGVLVPRRGLRLIAQEQQRVLDVPPTSRIYQLAAVSFDAFVFEFVLALSAGATLVLPGHRAAYAGPEAAARMRAERVTHLVATPTGLAAMDPADLPDLRVVCSVGEPCTAPVRDRWAPGRRMFNLYGPAEATIWATWSELDAGSDPTVIGRPITPVTARVLDDRLVPVPPGATGQLFLAGPTVALGYHRRPDLTAERFPTAADGVRMYATGDLVEQAADGALRYVGRTDDQVKIDGARVEPGEVEHVLSALTGVTAAAVVALTGPDGSTRLAAAYTGPATPDTVATGLRERVLRWMVPVRIERVPALPVGSTGKVDRAAVRDLLAAGTGPAAGRGHLLSPVQDLVLREARDLLHRDDLALSDDFFAAGGTSLRGLSLVVRTGDRLGVDLDLDGLYEARTLGGWADRVERGLADAEPAAGRVVARVVADPGAATRPAAGELEILVAEQYLAGSAAYLAPWCEHLRGDFDPDRFAAALVDTARRHDALRTRFRLGAGSAAVIVDPEPRPGFDRVDLAGADPAGPDLVGPDLVGAVAVAEAACARPFDLATEHPLRLHVVRFGADEWLVTVVVHHVACDAASFPILLDEAWRRYRGEPPPSGGAASYRDFAAWQAGFLGTADAQRQRDWWRDRLAGAAPLRLPAGPAGATGGRTGRRLRFELDPATVAALDATCQGLRITPFALLSAAYAVVLERYATPTDTVIGTLCTTRGSAAFDRAIGLFVNTLPVRLSLPVDGTVGAWLTGWSRTCLAMFARRDLPLSEITRVWQPPPGRTTRLSTLFALNYWRLATAGRHVPLDPGPVKFDLLLSVNLDPAVNLGELIHDTGVLPPAAAAELLAGFLRTLRLLCAAPGRPVAELFAVPEPLDATDFDFDLAGERR